MLVIHEERKCLNLCEALAVFLVDLCRYLHAMVADEVVNHFQLVEKGFFVERLAPEIKPNRIKDLFVLDSGEVGFLGLFVVFFEACHSFHNEAKARQRSKHNGVQGNAPSNRGSYDGFARNNVAKQIFSLKAAVQLLIAVVFLVVVGIEIFQHLNRAF